MGPGKVSRVQRIADNMAIVIVAINSGPGFINMLPGTAAQTGPVEFIFFCMPEFLIFGQQIGDLSRRDMDPKVGQKFLDLWLGHPAGIVLDDDQRPQAWAKLTLIATRQSGDVALLPGG